MVRLQLVGILVILIKNNLFQYHNGSIATSRGKRGNDLGIRRFNTIMVRLQRNGVLCISKSLQQFQYHNGSIATEPLLRSSVSHAEFQYHNGSIATIYEQLSWTPSISGFNTIMVRLQPYLCVP